MTRGRILTFGLLTSMFAAGYGVMFTMLDDFRDEYGIGEGSLGAVVAVGFFASFLAQSFIAPRADRGHARQLVYLGMMLNVAGLVAMAFGTTFLTLSVARFVMGVGAGMAVPAVRRIVIMEDPAGLGGNLGLLLSADVCGFAAGPAISALLDAMGFGLQAPFLVIAVATVACLPVIMRTHVDETSADDLPSSQFAFDLLRIRPFVASLLLGAAVFLMIGTFDALWVIVLEDMGAANWMGTVGISLFAAPLIFLGPPGGRLAERVGPFRLGAIGSLAGGGFLLAYGLLPAASAMFALAMVHSISDGLTISSSGVAAGQVVPADRQAGAQGLLGGVQTLTGGITALVTGALYENFGRGAAYITCAAAIAVCVGTAITLAGPLMRRPAPRHLDVPTPALATPD